MTVQEYSDICVEMLDFQEVNNRLSYTEGNQGVGNKETARVG